MWNEGIYAARGALRMQCATEKMRVACIKHNNSRLCTGWLISQIIAIQMSSTWNKVKLLCKMPLIQCKERKIVGYCDRLALWTNEIISGKQTDDTRNRIAKKHFQTCATNVCIVCAADTNERKYCFPIMNHQIFRHIWKSFCEIAFRRQWLREEVWAWVTAEWHFRKAIE